MECEWCGTVFCWDHADEAGDARKRHCSEECRKFHEMDRYRLRKNRQRCHRGTIRRFTTQQEARQEAGRLIAQTGGRFRAYDAPCPFCGQWHIHAKKENVRLRRRAEREYRQQRRSKNRLRTPPPPDPPQPDPPLPPPDFAELT